MRKALMVIAAVSLVGGCSSIPATSTAEETADLHYVARVEQAAKRYGTEVVWINLPQKRTTSTQ